ncbi:hypothetical protein BC939DRAFT_492979 [Gamsiella multidivaricata]|uniref:uncharacterized protein n=1 Tax=Gamsiella multidivaricata TaxID=101098 RepID=UPI00221F4142|nr:uncharacterized protein BC939DRAFT_492979 [Gamsiella multidivaricata]KAI7823579.1 hypothetical protein BC939DRAFT_492979 [Gamsiella multidivaricata]
MVATNSVLPIATQASTHALAQAIDTTTESTFKFLYFGLHGRGELIRNLLAYGGAKFEELSLDWPAMKKDTPFGVLPVLYETTSDGTVLELSESQAIERHLARKFDLLGSNSWENHLVDRYYTSMETLSVNFFKVLFAPLEKRNYEAEAFYRDHLPRWIAAHEAHLAKNGTNGHYVESQFTLADLKTALMVDRILLMVPKGLEERVRGLISEERTPGLWKVKETVNAHPRIAEWKKSERHAQIDAGTKGFFKF